MSRDDIREALLLLEEPAEASSEFRQTLLQRFIAEATAPEAAEAPEEPPPSRRRLPRWLRPRLVPAVAVVVVMALLSAVGLLVIRPGSAWAALERAREHFQRQPLHATISNSTQAFDADLNTVMEIRVVEIWFESETRWREETLSYNLFPGEAGTFVVTDGERFATYSPKENTFHIQPASEIDDPDLSGLAMHDPTQGAWSTSTGIKPTPQFLDENCRVSEDRIAGRAADKLTCKTGLEGDTLREATIWLDRETGFILKLETFACGTVEGERRCGTEAIREVKSIEFDPAFPDGIFEVTAPEGATVRGEPFEPGPESADTVDVDLDPSHIEAGLGAVWVGGGTSLREEEYQRGHGRLQRIDPGKRVVIATIDGVESFAVGEEFVWVVTRTEGGTFLQRLDPHTSRYIGAPLALTDIEPQDITLGEGAVWVVGATGEDRQRKGWLLRIDPATNEIRRTELEGMAGTQIAPDFAPSRVSVGGGAAWVNVRFQPADVSLEPINQIQKVDASTGTHRGKINPAGRVASVFGEGSLWTLTGGGRAATLTKIDPATLREIAKIDLPPNLSATFTTSYGMVWVLNSDAGTITKIDATGMRVLGEPIRYAREGGQAFAIADGNRTAWVGLWTGVGRGTLLRIDLRRA